MNSSESWGFKCLKCGNCCAISGSVEISGMEVDSISSHLALDVDCFVERYTDLSASRGGLKLKDGNDGSCIFLGADRLCLIEKVKPMQCRSFPQAWRYHGWEGICSARLSENNMKSLHFANDSKDRKI